MQMQLLTAALSRLPEFQQLLTALEGGRCPAALSGVAAIHRAHIAAGLALKTGRPVVVVCADESEGERMARDLTALSGKARASPFSTMFSGVSWFWVMKMARSPTILEEGVTFTMSPSISLTLR